MYVLYQRCQYYVGTELSLKVNHIKFKNSENHHLHCYPWPCDNLTSGLFLLNPLWLYKLIYLWMSSLLSFSLACRHHRPIEFHPWTLPCFRFAFHCCCCCYWSDHCRYLLNVFSFPQLDLKEQKQNVFNFTGLSKESIAVFPKCFIELTEFSDKNICKRARTCHPATSCVKRNGCYHSASKTHVRDRILHWAQSMLQWLIRFPEFVEFRLSVKVLLIVLSLKKS